MRAAVQEALPGTTFGSDEPEPGDGEEMPTEDSFDGEMVPPGDGVEDDVEPEVEAANEVVPESDPAAPSVKVGGKVYTEVEVAGGKKLVIGKDVTPEIATEMLRLQNQRDHEKGKAARLQSERDKAKPEAAPAAPAAQPAAPSAGGDPYADFVRQQTGVRDAGRAKMSEYLNDADATAAFESVVAAEARIQGLDFARRATSYLESEVIAPLVKKIEALEAATKDLEPVQHIAVNLRESNRVYDVLDAMCRENGGTAEDLVDKEAFLAEVSRVSRNYSDEDKIEVAMARMNQRRAQASVAEAIPTDAPPAVVSGRRVASPSVVSNGSGVRPRPRGITPDENAFDRAQRTAGRLFAAR
jgi:ferritin